MLEFWEYKLTDNGRQDVVTIILRLVNVQTGEVVISTTIEKTILSAETGGDVFKYFDADTLLVEIEAGVARNEPVTYAVRKAIEAGVVSLINDGAEKDLWEFDVAKVKVPAIKDYVDDIRVNIGEEKVEKTYEMYLEEKKAKKSNEVADEKLKDAAEEEAWKQVEEQDDKTNNDDSGDSGSHHN